MVTVQKYKDVSLEGINFEKAKKRNNNYYSKVKDLVIQTPLLKCVKGLGENTYPDYLEFEMDDDNFYDFIGEYENYITDVIYNNSEQWFGKIIPKEAVDNMFKSSIKASKKRSERPTFRVKFPYFKSNNKINFDIYTNKRKAIDYNQIPQDAQMKLIIKSPFISFSSQQASSEWEIVQIKVYFPTKKLKGAESFLEDSEEDFSD